jgi:hypothetical protein
VDSSKWLPFTQRVRRWSSDGDGAGVMVILVEGFVGITVKGGNNLVTES